ncbi:3'-5' exonuclease [Malassezia cuniculi]|uniref:RNA exonuclease 4 n=1 Tax=Malassezia cuniculi TaxID=948313 RepID=A0AAF0J657_9BASI|nr:3'-5' exonuclease [Malassezia cuniculi]
MPKMQRTKSIDRPSGNWATLSKQIGAGTSRRRSSTSAGEEAQPGAAHESAALSAKPLPLLDNAIQWEGYLDAETKKRVVLGHDDLPESQRELGHFVALDCEMVGVGYKGCRSALARVSIVNWYGYVVYDTFVKPKEPVTDYRTWVSGVRQRNLVNAPSFEEAQKRVADIIKGRVLVGHAVQNDLHALLLSHPHTMIRDTGSFKPLLQKTGKKQNSLRELADILLGIKIQVKGAPHSSVEDARATMAVFRTQKTVWDEMLGVGKKTRRKSDANADQDVETDADAAQGTTHTQAKQVAAPADVVVRGSPVIEGVTIDTAGMPTATEAAEGAAVATEPIATKKRSKGGKGGKGGKGSKGGKGGNAAAPDARRPQSAPGWWLDS